MKRFVLHIYFILAPFLNIAQQIQPVWERTEATDGSTGTQYRPLPIVLVDSFHNVIVCGETYNPGPLIGFITTKYDSSGNLLWQRQFDTPAQDLITSAVTDNTGAVYVGGNTTNPFTNKAGFVIIKYAADGDTLWQYLSPFEVSSYFNPSALLLDSAQNLLVFSNFIDVSSNNSGLKAIKLNPNGEVVWETLYDESDYGYIGTDAHWIGEHIVFWGLKGSSEGSRFIAWQISNDGETLESATSEPYTEAFGSGYHIDRFGNLFIGDQAYEYKLTKFRLDGVIEWTYNKPVIFPPTIASAISLQNISTDTEGAVYISGVHSDTTGPGGVSVKLSADGDFFWEQKIAFNDVNRAFPRSIKWIDTNLLLVTGIVSINIDSNFYEPFFAFYDQNGLIRSGISDIGGNKNWPVSITSNNKYFYVTGISAITFPISEPDNQFLCKYALSDIVTTVSPKMEAVSTGRITVIPNPFRDKCRISVIHDEEDTRGVLEMRDSKNSVLYHREVHLIQGINNYELNSTHRLPWGMYKIVLITPSKLYTARAMKSD